MELTIIMIILKLFLLPVTNDVTSVLTTGRVAARRSK